MRQLEAEGPGDLPAPAVDLRVFISYRREDSAAEAGRISDFLKSLPGMEVFLDVHDVQPGADFVRAINREVAKCDVFLAIVGATWLATLNSSGDDPDRPDYVRTEVEAALRRRGVPVIPVLVRGAQFPSAPELPEGMRAFARRSAIHVSHENWDSDISALTEALRQAAAEKARSRRTRRVSQQVSPYRGLASFGRADARFFFGRASVIDKLTGSVAAGPVTALLGPSGTGKSSVLFAGLLPRLEADGGYTIATMRPASLPYRALAGSLIPLLEGDMSETEKLIEVQRLSDGLAAGALPVDELVRRIVTKQENRPLLLIVDQFEELYTLVADAGQIDAFVDLLLDGAALAAPSMKLVIAARADFLARMLVHRQLADAIQDRDVKLGPMNTTELLSAICEPAALFDVKFQAGLVDRIVADVQSQPGSLPLVEFALTLLWERQSNGFMTHEAYDEIGGVSQALTKHADEVLSRMAPADQEKARRILVQLVEPGDGAQDTRRVASASDMRGDDWLVVSQLATERLVVTGRDEQVGIETAEIVHEALIDHWSALRGWLSEDRKYRMWQEEVRRSAAAWNAERRSPDRLLRGAALDEAENWLKDRTDPLGSEAARFVRASRRRRLLGQLGWAVVVAGIVGIVVSAFRSGSMDQHTHAYTVASETLPVLFLYMIGAALGFLILRFLVTTWKRWRGARYYRRTRATRGRAESKLIAALPVGVGVGVFLFLQIIHPRQFSPNLTGTIQAPACAAGSTTVEFPSLFVIGGEFASAVPLNVSRKGTTCVMTFDATGKTGFYPSRIEDYIIYFDPITASSTGEVSMSEWSSAHLSWSIQLRDANTGKVIDDSVGP